MDTVIGASRAFSREDLEARAAKLAARGLGWSNKIEPELARFLAQIHEDAAIEDMEGVTVEDVAALAVGFWEFGETRQAGQTLIRLESGRTITERPLSRDVLEIITDDKPFLVDTVMGEVNAQGGEVLAMFHPLVTVERGPNGKRGKRGTPIRESMMQVHIAPLDEDARQTIAAQVALALGDVEVAVADHGHMLARMDQVIEELKTARTPATTEEREEAVAFLRWLRSDHFAFLGCRAYEFPISEAGDYPQREPNVIDDSSRGVLRDLNRYVLRNQNEPAIITPKIADFLREPSPVIVAKSNLQSRVHRRVAMDYIGVKRYREDGEVIGETRFVGLFTAEAYLSPANEVPLIRRKTRRVLDRADKAPGSHNHKRLQFILETYPRDELFQSEEDELFEIALGMLHLYDRPRPRLFTRRDRYDRYVSAFAFVPRERFDSQVRIAIGDMLAAAYRGMVTSFYTNFTNAPLARVHYIIQIDREHKAPSVDVLERRLAAYARTWQDDFERHARAYADRDFVKRLPTYDGAFSAGYRERFEPEEALTDAREIEALNADPRDDAMAVRAYRATSAEPNQIGLKIYHKAEAGQLSTMMHRLERMGFDVHSEASFPVRRTERPANGEPQTLEAIWIHDFDMRAPDGAAEFDVVKQPIEEAIQAVWDGFNENDHFNRLVPMLGLHWRDVCFLRACARYRGQTGADPSQGVQEDALADNPAIVRLILELKTVRFDPAFAGDRNAEQARIQAEIASQLDQVASLDADRVLRRIANLVAAIQRTNVYQTDPNGRPKPWIAIKIASRELEHLPEPKPYREIFVWAPHVEGVHIRFGPVARGGLRWSDRRDDFRKEVLDLVKAQQVKNAVIVPVGSKGGFFPKQLPRGGSREAIQAEAIRAYTTFISGMLDVTDNLVDNAVVHPPQVQVWDGEDPYLVVAADKGTASFSDIANGIAADYKFWLGDAFASGGSVGYDHKKMGITARGAWVAVQRHFRERGKDIQEEPFSVIGVGDMSGDVFGNGMLLSRHIRLCAAFDHRDIFIDPNPTDVETSWLERKRLFELDRSTWKQYNTELISEGGGVFSRAAKAITLTPQIQALTGLTAPTATPDELIRALLKADVELLWFGGIGTYIKAPEETNDWVGDRANDNVRITAHEVRAKVIGEGANLGATQAGRVALARQGVKLNADFIDNAAGVDTSDHEVNIKILLNAVMRAGGLSEAQRPALLAQMTDTVANHVLRHNYDQTLAITMAEHTAAEDLDAYERLIGRLEARGELDRAVMGLPNGEDFYALKEQGLGLTRPEISVLISHAKIAVFNRLMESTVPDDPHFEAMLLGYFPADVRENGQQIGEHRLRREIICTVLANDIVNLGGATFTHRARESTGGTTRIVARAFEVARQVFRLSELIDEIHMLDNRAPADVQIALYQEVVTVLRRQTYWLVRRAAALNDLEGERRKLQDVISLLQPGVDALRAIALDIISPFERARVDERTNEFIAAGAPEELASRVGRLRALVSSTDVIVLANEQDWPLEITARLYHAMGDHFGFDRMRGAAGALSSTEHWDRLAVRRMIEDFYSEQFRLTGKAMAIAGKAPKAKHDAAAAIQPVLDTFAERFGDPTARLRELTDELERTGAWTLSKLAILATELRDLAA